MEGYDAWKLHRAIKFHLLNIRYDLFAHEGRTSNSSIDDFLKQRDRQIFEFIGSQFTRSIDIVQFFVANIAYTGNDSVHESGVAWENYLLWMKNKESLTKVITDDLDRIDVNNDIKGNPPKLLSMILARKITPETAVAINRVHPFVDEWLEKQYFGAGNWPVIIKKMDRFVKYNEERIKDLICQNQ